MFGFYYFSSSIIYWMHNYPWTRSSNMNTFFVCIPYIYLLLHKAKCAVYIHIHILAYKCTIQYLVLSSNIIILINVMYVLSNFLSGKSKVIFISRVVVRSKIGKRNNENIIRFISFLIKLLKSHAIHSSGMYDYM